MAEYIEREALYEKAYWHGEHPDVGNPFPDGVDAIDIKDVDAIPSVDVAPVRHGRWVDKPLIKSFKHTNIPVVECSECGIDFCDIINNHYFMYRFCPNCGARMDGDK